MSNEQSVDPTGPDTQQDPSTEEGVDEATTDEAAAEPAGDAEAPDSEDASPETRIARLQAELEQARNKAEENWERVLRTEAEKDNIRKRAERDAESARRYALEKFANELLAVRDSLELGLDAAQQEDADIDKIREGTELTHKMLTQAMEKFDIEAIDPLGEKFNPELHQAMSMQEVEGQESNTVVSVMQKGYRLNDRLLRPALVMVAK